MQASKELQAESSNGIHKMYLVSVTALVILFPAVATLIQHYFSAKELTFFLFGKWFIFSAVGLRLLLAGVKQSTDPSFTAKQIFHIEGKESFPVVRELGFANVCFGITAIISLWKPEWRLVIVFASGLYYGLAAAMHVIKKPVGANEKFALWTDLFVFLMLLIYFIKFI